MIVFYPLLPTGQKDVPQSTSSSTAAQVTGNSSSFSSGDVQIPTGSADVAADITKYTNKVILTILLHINNITSL